MSVFRKLFERKDGIMNLVGLESLKTAMSEIVSKADAYRKGGAKVPHVVMNLTHENGQSIVANYISSVLYENRLRKFCGLDILLEYRVDGNLRKMKRIFEDIASNAVYTNEYEGVVALDISELSEFINEFQVDYFVEQIGSVAQNATVIIYYDASLGKRMQIIKERVVNTIGNCIDVPVTPYSQKEYFEIVVQNIIDRGIEVDTGDDLKNILCRVMDTYHVTSARQAVAVAEDLAFYADYSHFTPRINSKMVSEHFTTGKVCL